MSSSSKPIRVLFVCMGNICRSPAADIVFRSLVREAGLDGQIECDSAGTIGYHAGHPPDARMAAELGRRGYEIHGSARQIRAADLEDFDLVLVADRENLADVRELEGAERRADRIRLLTDYCREHDADHVPDPYYGGSSGFRRVADLVEDACQGLLDELASGRTT